MNLSSEKVDSIISEKRIKLHHFKPSNRKIWTVVGSSKEYWLDPDLGFCTCPSYYFNESDGKNDCYHLKSFDVHNADNQIERIVFSDHEYEDFISGLLSDL